MNLSYANFKFRQSITTQLGLMPPRIGIRRSNAMGIILVPIMLYIFAQEFDGFGFI
jgi:TctA family transporter